MKPIESLRKGRREGRKKGGSEVSWSLSRQDTRRRIFRSGPRRREGGKGVVTEELSQPPPDERPDHLPRRYTDVAED